MDSKQIKRHAELTIIFGKMGKVLSNEGIEEKDVITQSLGSLLMYLSSCVSSKKELLLISEFCNMVACKKLIEDVRSNEIDTKFVHNMGEIEKLNMSDEELLNVIKVLRIKLGLDNSNG